MPKLGADFPYSDAEVLKICKEHPTPLHIYNEKGIRDTVRGLNAAFSWSPGFRNYFAVKATPNPYIMKVLKEEGCGADCSSITEMILSDKVGYKGKEIMFTSNNTPIKEFRKAKELGAIVNIDDLTHVDFLHEQAGLPDLVSFRFNPGPERTGNVLIGDPKEAKFGTTKSQLMAGYKRCKELGVKHFALHTMVVSNCLKVDELVETSRMLFNLCKEIKKETGIQMETINLGGGIGVNYRPHEQVIDVAAVGAGVKKMYDEFIANGGFPVKIVMECGRYITGPSGLLMTRCIHEKRTYKNYVGVDACMANLMRPGMYDAYHHITVVKNPEQVEGLPSRNRNLPDNIGDRINGSDVYDVVGGLCENNDKFAVDRPLDPEPHPGDVIVIHDAGAHGHSMGFNYNGKPRSAEYLYREDGSVLQIRRAETPDDLFSTIDMSGLPFFDAANPVAAFLGSLGFVGSTAQSRRRILLGVAAGLCGVALMRLRK